MLLQPADLSLGGKVHKDDSSHPKPLMVSGNHAYLADCLSFALKS